MRVCSLAGVLLFSATFGAMAVEYDLCARGVGETFSRTTHVRLSVEGPALGSSRDRLAAQWVNHLVWQGRAQEVFVEDFDESLCSASLGELRLFSVSITQVELNALSAEFSRGNNDRSPTADAVGDRAKVSVKERPPASGIAAADLLVRIYFATNRNDSGKADPAQRYGNDRSDAVSFGTVVVSIPKQHEMGMLETPSILKLEFRNDAEKHVLLKEMQPLLLDAWREELRKRAVSFGRPGVLLFIHGFNSSFSQAAIRTGQLAYDLGFPGPTVFFSWPSRGSLVPYPADEQAAEWAVMDLKSVLAELADLHPGAPVYVIAHSMGNRVLTRAFVKLLEDAGTQSKRRQFREIVLAAPDIDAAVFKREIAPLMLGVGPRVTLYASSNDKALVASRTVHGNYRRLGEGGDAITVLPGMDSIDASHVDTDLLGHSYFGDSGTVMSDLFYLIRTRAAPKDRFRLAPVGSPSGSYWQIKP